MHGKKGYGQFCPVARAAELVAVRWMPLVLRELMCGTCRFADFRRGIPLITPAVLSQRLNELVDAGVVKREQCEEPDKHVEYRLTAAGEGLRAVIDALGAWGQLWDRRELHAHEIDPELLMWVTRRRLNLSALPCTRAVMRFDLSDVPAALRRFWFVVQDGSVDICLRNPGHEVNLTVTASVRTLTLVYLGHLDARIAIRSGGIVLCGSRKLSRSFPDWFARSPFAENARQRNPEEVSPRLACTTATSV